ncbi:MAG: hypothetical protein ACLQUY_22085 [Ktedonobacterales bacterium]
MSRSRVKRWWKLSTVILVLVVGLTVGALGITVPHVAAAPLHAKVASSVPVRELDKEVLPETSIDGPAFSSLSDYVPQSPAYGSPPASVIAWTGTDSYHSLNVMESVDGFKYQQKVTLHEDSATRPAVLLFANKTIGTLSPNLVVLAWTGTDPNHSLNVMFDVYGARQMITLRENSLFSPALAYFNGQVWLAWTGTDSGRSLNVMAMGPDGLTPGHKTILSGAGYSSRSGPSLRVDTRDNLLLLTWALMSSPPYIDLAQSSDGATWTTSFSPPPPQTSGSGPDVLAVPGIVATGLPTDYWTWTGTDAAHSLNIAYTSTLASWPAPIVTLNEQALGSPALGFSNELGLTPANTVPILLAWTGLDPAHHLNVAVIQIG